MTSTQTRYVLDAAERTAATFVEAAIGTWLLNPVVDLDAGKSAALAGVVAAAALVKSIAAKFVGSSATAALLPAVDDTPAAEG